MSAEDSGKDGNGTRVEGMERRSEDNRAGENCDGKDVDQGGECRRTGSEKLSYLKLVEVSAALRKGKKRGFGLDCVSTSAISESELLESPVDVGVEVV